MGVAIVIIGVINLVFSIFVIINQVWWVGLGSLLSALALIYVGFKCIQVVAHEKRLDNIEQELYEMKQDEIKSKENMLKKASVKLEEKSHDKFDGWVCPRCGHKNLPTASKCENCFKEKV